MGSKADDVSHGGATAAVFLDDLATEEKREGACDAEESKDEATRSAEAAGKFGSIGAPTSKAFACHRKIPRRPKEDCVEAELLLLLPTCGQSAPLIDWYQSGRVLFRLPCILIFVEEEESHLICKLHAFIFSSSWNKTQTLQHCLSRWPPSPGPN